MAFRGSFIITGTDTNAGKTLAAACLLLGTGGRYWKPLQSGVDEISQLTDREWVQKITELHDGHFLRETYKLKAPLSPHRAAELENININPENLLADYQHHISNGNLLIEGAGGLMVPITRKLLQIDLFAQMNAIAAAPIILVARTGLGTINHTLLSVASIHARKLPLHGILFSGPENADNIRTIEEISGARILGHIPQLDTINAHILSQVFTGALGKI